MLLTQALAKHVLTVASILPRAKNPTVITNSTQGENICLYVFCACDCVWMCVCVRVRVCMYVFCTACVRGQ